MVEQPLSAADTDFVTTLYDDLVSFVVLMLPRDTGERLLESINSQAPSTPGEGYGDESAHQVAADTLEHSLKRLRDAGAQASGSVVEGHPLDLLRSVVDQTRPDEVIVLTAPHRVEEFFHRDWANQARSKVDVPVLKLYSHNDEDSTGTPA